VPFRDIIGHRRLIALLSRAAARDALPPSLLFAGPRGVGKRKAAVALAQALNCLRPVDRSADVPAPGTRSRDACGECASCRRIDRGVHSDIIVIQPGDSGSIKIEEIRAVVASAGYRPFEARRRVVIIDDADAMVTQAQSALLKTLEEPPSASVFLLVSSMPDALLATVRSRCPRLRFGAMAPAEVAEALMTRFGYAEPEARAAAADAEGSIGLALSVRSVDVAGARETARRLLEQTARVSDPARRMDVAKELTGKKGTAAEERERLASYLRALSSLLRDLGVMATQADARVLANADLQDELGRLAQAFDSHRSTRAFAAVDRARGALERNASPKVVADWLVLQL
jgi:DNA polymerase-3 subunit delta'